MTRGLDNSRKLTGEVADATGDFACLVFRSFGGICENASCPVTNTRMFTLAGQRQAADYESFKYDTELQQLVISSGRPLILFG